MSTGSYFNGHGRGALPIAVGPNAQHDNQLHEWRY